MRRKVAKLFICMLGISAATFGGGFVIVALMKKKLVDELKWIDEGEMLDITSLAQAAPGAISVNAAILTGWRVAGAWGMAAAVLGAILPPMVIFTGVSICYEAFAANAYVRLALTGMRAGVAAIVIDVVINLGGNVARQRSLFSDVIMAAAFAAVFFLKINLALVIVSCALAGLARACILQWRRARQ